MSFNTKIALTAALTGLTVANPINLSGVAANAVNTVNVLGAKTFSLVQVKNTASTLKPAPILVIANTYAKYTKAGASTPPSIKTAVKAAVQQGSVTASPEAYDEVGFDHDIRTCMTILTNHTELPLSCHRWQSIIEPQL